VNLTILIGRFPPGPIGGAEIQAEGWATRLADRHRVTVVTRRDSTSQPRDETRDGFRVVRLEVSRLPLARTALDVMGIERAVLAITPRPDVLLCFQTFVSGFAGVRIQRRHGIPAVVWIRGEEEYRLSRPGMTRRLSPGVWAGARGVLVQTEENRTHLLEELSARSPAAAEGLDKRLVVVPNGLGLPAVSAARGARVLAVGRLIPEKGMDLVIEAAAQCRAGVTIAGAGPERERLEALARALRADVRFEGAVARPRLEALYREAACVVLASRRGEGLPNVLLEAMAHARPVIATPVAGVRGLVQDGANGFLVPVDDASALAAAIARVLGSPELADRLGAAARATVEPFAWAHVRPKLESALERWAAR
jgi:glycosyltransferase involved in cell wall biosynthesis